MNSGTNHNEMILDREISVNLLESVLRPMMEEPYPQHSDTESASSLVIRNNETQFGAIRNERVQCRTS
jgi:hypothetical protein